MAFTIPVPPLSFQACQVAFKGYTYFPSEGPEIEKENLISQLRLLTVIASFLLKVTLVKQAVQ